MSVTMQPAIVIGVGGSGLNVIRRLKRRLAAGGEEWPYIRFLGIDTAPQEPETPESPRLAPGEFLHCANFNTDTIVHPNHLPEHPEIQQWWRYSNVASQHITQGAGQVRPYGRLALFVKFGELRSRIETHVRQIFDSKQFQGLPDAYRQRLTVFIVSSTCGGTGTGMFLDLALAVPRIINGVMPGVAVIRRGVLFLPSAFTHTNTVSAQEANNLRANAWGALTELDALTARHGPWGEEQKPKVSYPGLGEVPLARPFKHCYLVGNRTTAGAVISSIDTLLEKTAIHLHISLASPLLDATGSIEDNIAQQMETAPEPSGRSALFSSFSCDWLELPVQRVRDRWRKHAAQQLLEELKAATEEGPGPGPAQLQASPGYSRLSALLGKGAVGPFLPEVESARSAFLNIPPEEPRSADDLIASAAAMQRDAAAEIHQRAVRLRAELSEAIGQLGEEVRSAARAELGRSSLRSTMRFLDGVLQELRGWQGRATSQASGGTGGGWDTRFGQKLTAMRKGMLETRTAFAQRQRTEVLAAVAEAEKQWKTDVLGTAGAHAQQPLGEVIGEIQGVIDGLRKLAVAAPGAAQVIARDPEAPIVQAHANVITDEQSDAAFAAPERQQQLSDALVEARGALLGDADIADETSLADFARRAVARPVESLVTAYLASQRLPADQVAERVNSLSPLVVFTNHWTQSPAADQVRPLWLVGVPATMSDQSREIEARLEQQVVERTRFVPHGGTDQVVVTLQDHGFPLYGVAEVAECHEAFKGLAVTGRPQRFLFPHPESTNWSLFPPKGEEILRLFMLGMALGLVRREGTEYVWHEDGAQPQVLDGDVQDPVAARQKALRRFGQDGLATRVDGQLRASARKHGNDALRDRLREWLQTEQGRAQDAGYPAEFRTHLKEVESYVQALA